MATVRCRHCHHETDSSLTNCQHCGTSLKASGLMSHLKPRTGELKPSPGEPQPAKPETSEPPRQDSAGVTARFNARVSSADDLPYSAVIFYHAEDFFAVHASGERSIIARLFGSALELPSLCSAMLFSAYAALVEHGLARLQVAAVTPTGQLIFPIPAQWIKLIFETLSLHPSQPTSLEGMLMARAKGRVSSNATQQLIADLTEWHSVTAAIGGRDQLMESPIWTWNRHYAEAITAVVRQYYPNGRSSSRATVEKTEALLRQFYQNHKQMATYLSHEISLIVNWISSKQDPTIQQRYQLTVSHAPNLLHVSPTNLYDAEYWRTIAQYARRQG